MFLYFTVALCKTYIIKRYQSDEYLTSSFDPFSLPTLGPESVAHIFEIGHPETDSKISILRLACVPRINTIPDVVLDATKEQDKVAYFTYNNKLANEEFKIIRYEDAYILVRGEDCVTYNRKKQYFYTTLCVPKNPEQLFELIEQPCSKIPEKIPLEMFLSQQTPPLLTKMPKIVTTFGF